MSTMARDFRGFTIIETMVATLILAVAFLGLTTVHAMSSRAQTLGATEGAAATLASEQIELMRRSTWANLQAATLDRTIDGVSYHIVRTVSDVPTARRIDVTVTWNTRLGTRTATAQTIVSQVTNPS